MNVTKLRGLAGVPSWGTLCLHFPHESELNTHLGMKASSSENKLPVKSDVPFLSERKEQRPAVLLRSLVSPQARQAARARPCGCSGKTWTGAGPCIADMLKGLWKTEASLTMWSEKFKWEFQES